MNLRTGSQKEPKVSSFLISWFVCLLALTSACSRPQTSKIDVAKQAIGHIKEEYSLDSVAKVDAPFQDYMKSSCVKELTYLNANPDLSDPRPFAAFIAPLPDRRLVLQVMWTGDGTSVLGVVLEVNEKKIGTYEIWQIPTGKDLDLALSSPVHINFASVSIGGDSSSSTRPTDIRLASSDADGMLKVKLLRRDRTSSVATDVFVVRPGVEKGDSLK